MPSKKTYWVDVTLTASQAFSLLGALKMMAITAPDESKVTIAGYNKVADCIYNQLTPKDKKGFDEMFSVALEVMKRPSIGKGMYQGGVDALIEDITEEYKNKDK